LTKVTQNLQINTLRGTEMYMSPLLFNGLRTNQIDIKHNLFKSDVYSLGLCILYACTLSNESVYDIRKFVDMNDVKQFIKKSLEKKYSKRFIELIENMLEINERNRPDFIQLEKKLKEW
jgi:serine/threonine protein kinase